MTKKRIPTIPLMLVGDEVVETKSVARYLCIMIDCKLNFGEQIRGSAEKVEKGVIALIGLMAKVTGPKWSKRRLPMSNIQSVLLYGAEVWAEAVDKEMFMKQLARL